jgi:hypothetical protein
MHVLYEAQGVGASRIHRRVDQAEDARPACEPGRLYAPLACAKAIAAVRHLLNHRWFGQAWLGFDTETASQPFEFGVGACACIATSAITPACRLRVSCRHGMTYMTGMTGMMAMAGVTHRHYKRERHLLQNRSSLRGACVCNRPHQAIPGAILDAILTCNMPFAGGCIVNIVHVTSL